jgi:hypothetical protein
MKYIVKINNKNVEIECDEHYCYRSCSRVDSHLLRCKQFGKLQKGGNGEVFTSLLRHLDCIATTKNSIQVDKYNFILTSEDKKQLKMILKNQNKKIGKNRK